MRFATSAKGYVRFATSAKGRGKARHKSGCARHADSSIKLFGDANKLIHPDLYWFVMIAVPL